MIEVGRIWEIGAEGKTQSILYERVLRRKDKKGSISLAAVCYSNLCRQSQYEDLEVQMCCRAFIQCEIFKDVGFIPGEPNKAMLVSVLYPWSCFLVLGSCGSNTRPCVACCPVSCCGIASWDTGLYYPVNFCHALYQMHSNKRVEGHLMSPDHCTGFFCNILGTFSLKLVLFTLNLPLIHDTSYSSGLLDIFLFSLPRRFSKDLRGNSRLISSSCNNI